MNNRLRAVLRIITCFILILSLTPASVPARKDKGNDSKYIFYKGNTLYEEGKYDEAIEAYSKLLEQGIESGSLYYNIGNCYFKKGDIGKALLNYERAKRLIPGDSDLASNYSYARSLIKGGTIEISTSWFKRVFNIFDFFTINGLTIFISGVFTLIFFFLLTGLFVPLLKRYYQFVLPVLLIVLVLGTVSLYNRVSILGKEAVIISEREDAKFEPFDNATTFFMVHEGMKVNIIESKKNWSKIKRSDGKAAWIKSSGMEKI